MPQQPERLAYHYSHEHHTPGAIEVTTVTDDGHVWPSVIIKRDRDMSVQVELTMYGCERVSSTMLASLCPPDDLSSMTSSTVCVIFKS